MSELVRIKSGELEVNIDPYGAWLQTFSALGSDLLFPKQVMTTSDKSEKIRGGCHVCLPNFGPGGGSGLPQHGFGRDELWERIMQKNKAIAIFENLQTTGAYDGLISRLMYSLSETKLTMELKLHNTSDADLRVAPGFHPYFAIGDSESVEIDGLPQNLSDCNPAIELETAPTQLKTGETAMQLHAQNLSHWILWTDQLGPYVCLEPTSAGFSFEHPAEPTELLHPNQQASYSLAIAIS